MSYEQLSLWEHLDSKVITKPIRLIELFSGIGSQAYALKNLGVDYEPYRTCDWNVTAILAYEATHIDSRYYVGLIRDVDIDVKRSYIKSLHLSTNDVNEITDKQLDSKSEAWINKVYQACVATGNIGNISYAKAKDLGVIETDKYEYIMTYSFPCQDLSIAGKGAGMAKGSSTRSGLLWEVERILEEMDEKPQILLMENVPALLYSTNIRQFQDWVIKLEELGYSNFVEVLDATDYGIPQHRERCFMVSILGEWKFKMPKGWKLQKRLKDMLEPYVDESYFLTEEQIEKLGITFKEEPYVSQCASRPYRKEESIEGSAPTLLASASKGHTAIIVDGINESSATLLVPTNSKKRFLEAHDGDGIYINRIDKKRGTVSNESVMTLKCTGDEIGVVVSEPLCLNQYDDNGKQRSHQDRIYDDTGVAPAITTSFHPSYATSSWERVYETEGVAPTLKKVGGGNAEAKIRVKARVRKLTPKEYFRLFGFSDLMFSKIAERTSKTSLYHLAGNSIVTTVLMAIFGVLLDVDWKTKILEHIETIICYEPIITYSEANGGGIENELNA